MMFGFRGVDAKIAITRSDGIYVDDGTVEVLPEQQANPQQVEGEQHGNEQQSTQEG